MSGVFPRYRNYFSDDVATLRSPLSVHAATCHPPSSEEQRRVKRAGLCNSEPAGRSHRIRAGAGAATPGLRRSLRRLFRDPPARQWGPGPLHRPRRRRSRHGGLVRILRNGPAATVIVRAGKRGQGVRRGCWSDDPALTRMTRQGHNIQINPHLEERSTGALRMRVATPGISLIPISRSWE
jgi:hypothetical protein